MSLDPLTQPAEIDPASFKGTFGSDVNPSQHLRFAIYAAREAARTTGEIVLVYQDEAQGQEGYRIRRLPEKQFHETLVHQCPKALDDSRDTTPAVFLRAPIQLPSALAYPDGRVVVSKPRLCESCQNQLTKALRGRCEWLQYESLKEMPV